MDMHDIIAASIPCHCQPQARRAVIGLARDGNVFSGKLNQWARLERFTFRVQGTLRDLAAQKPTILVHFGPNFMVSDEGVPLLAMIELEPLAADLFRAGRFEGPIVDRWNASQADAEDHALLDALQDRLTHA